MEAIILNASPKINGNTKHVTNLLISKLEGYEIKSFDLVTMDINDCTGCLNCSITGECIYSDDMKKIYKEVDNADLVIFTTPIYFNSVSSIGKRVIDRFQRNYARRFMLSIDEKIITNKKGILIATAGSIEKNNEFDGLRFPMNLFFKANGIVKYDELIITSTDKENIEESDIDKKISEFALNYLKTNFKSV